jgi:hypothetical protein
MPERLRRARSFLLALLLPLTCAACNVFSNADLNQSGPTIAECEKKAQQVGLPPIPVGADFRVIVARYKAALIKADKNIGDISQCLALIDKFERQGLN